MDPVDDFLFNGGVEEVFDFHVAGFGEGNENLKREIVIVRNAGYTVISVEWF